MSERIVICHCCDNVVRIPDGSDNTQNCCPRCGAVLRPAKIAPLRQVAAVAASAIVMLIACINLPFMSVESMGVRASMSLITIFSVLEMDWTFLLQLFAMVTFFFPLNVLGTIVLVGFFNYRPGVTMAKLYGFCHSLCMVDVFVLGIAVSLIKLTAMVSVSFHSGFFVSFVFSVMMIWCCSKCRPGRIWELNRVKANIPLQLRTGLSAKCQHVKVCKRCGLPVVSTSLTECDRCPRCEAKVSFRNDRWVQKCTALLTAALILYLPANLYPIMVTTLFGSSNRSNIIDGVIALWGMGSWFVAAVILLASIFIPVFKILSLAYLVYEVKFGRRTNSRFLSRLYRFVELIGKWSMIDVFVVIIMSSIVRMSGIVTIDPGFAIICFCFVVLVTIFAAEEFDERLIWDKYYD